MNEKHTRWTGDEIEKFVAMYPTAPLDVLEKEFGLKKSSLNSAAHRYGVKRNRQFVKADSDIYHNLYTQYELDFIRNNYKTMTDEEIAIAIGRSRGSVKNHRNEMGLFRRINKNTAYENTSIYIRRHNVEWKKKSMQYCNFKCILSGDRFDEIHHLVSLNTILKSTYDKLHIDSELFDINTISENEKQIFLNEFYTEQDKYPLGVCLRKDIHAQFHNAYKYGDNTPEQFYKFAKEFYPNAQLNLYYN